MWNVSNKHQSYFLSAFVEKSDFASEFSGHLLQKNFSRALLLEIFSRLSWGLKQRFLGRFRFV